MEIIGKILRHFLPGTTLVMQEQLSGGVIHATYRLVVEKDQVRSVYILQKLNQVVFPNLMQVMENINKVQFFLKQTEYPLQLSTPLADMQGNFLFQDTEGNYWRIFHYISNSITYSSIKENQQAFQAGFAFGLFLAALKDFDASSLQTTIPDFHNLPKRYTQLQKAITKANPDRKRKAEIAQKKVLRYYLQFQDIDFSNLPIRAVHNDCKISNLLFDQNSLECIAVIDLDTVMPGSVVMDFGDMVRTMCCSVSEEEKDLEKVKFLPERYRLLYQGFLESTDSLVEEIEKAQLFNGAIYIILEQAIRFLSDYMEDDIYYVTHYPEQNLNRTLNQLKLLELMLESEIARAM